MSPPNAIPFGGDIGIEEMTLHVRRLTVSGGAGFVRGEVGYVYTDSTVRKAIDTSAAAAEGVVMALGTVADGAAGMFLCAPGVVDGLSGGTIAALGYVGNTAGAITVTAPTTAGRFSKILGRYLSATVFFFNPDRNVYPIY